MEDVSGLVAASTLVTTNSGEAEQNGESAPAVPVDQESGTVGDDGDSSYDSDDLSRYTDSLSSSVKEYKFENGRRYHAFHSGVYNFPNDDPEQDRLDMFHHIIQMACHGNLYLTPLDMNGKRILDIGCGTGIWAIQMGDEYPSADIIGNDLSPIQPGWVPPNVRFLVDDVEQSWAETQPYDYIHCRYMAASIQDWPRLVKQCFEHLKPGGWVEFQDYDTACISQDDTMPKDYKVAEMLSLLRGALDSIGRLLDPGPHLKEWVENAGFENITHRIIPLPVGIWPKEKKMKEIGAFMTVQYTAGVEAFTLLPFPVGIWPKEKKMKEIGAFMTVQYTAGVEAFTLLPFTGILGWTKEEVEVFNVAVRNHAKDRRIHTLHNFHIVYAQKPLTGA